MYTGYDWDKAIRDEFAVNRLTPQRILKLSAPSSHHKLGVAVNGLQPIVDPVNSRCNANELKTDELTRAEVLWLKECKSEPFHEVIMKERYDR